MLQVFGLLKVAKLIIVVRRLLEQESLKFANKQPFYDVKLKKSVAFLAQQTLYV
jgi:hypothetical protein|tara:strand:+ start:356 stop:517 length:162 start_codon:yes stop_codon:yes gene_type:complete